MNCFSKLGKSCFGEKRTYEVTSDKVLVVERPVFTTSEDIEVLGQSNQAAEKECDDGSPET